MPKNPNNPSTVPDFGGVKNNLMVHNQSIHREETVSQSVSAAKYITTRKVPLNMTLLQIQFF